MGIKLFLVSSIVDDSHPPMIVWADDAKAALEAGTRFTSPLDLQKPAPESLDEGLGGSDFPAVLEPLDTPYVLHFQFDKHRYCVTKNNPVFLLSKTGDSRGDKPFEQKHPSSKPPLKKSFSRRWVDEPA